MSSCNDTEFYFIGFSPINGICNESFFSGSITVYPNYEKGNIFYSDKLVDISSQKFLLKYKEFVCDTIKSIQEKNKNVNFLCFNDNKRTKDLCSDMVDVNIVVGNSNEIINLLNDKFTIRKAVENTGISILDYIYVPRERLNYEHLRNALNSNKFVVQAKCGAGGNTTFFVGSSKDFKNIEFTDDEYAVSKYVNNTPINATIIVGENDTLLLPISIQLISCINNKFIYLGGDFIASQKLEMNLISEINNYSLIIGDLVRKLGYRGIMGIDYLLCADRVVFMEINPRYQASTFLISKNLERTDNTSIAALHYQAITGKRLKSIKLNSIDYSFLNCKKEKYPFENDALFEKFNLIKNGYFKKDFNSIYRKVYSHSIFVHSIFEKLDTGG